MKHVPEQVLQTVGRALGKIPSGVFVLTATHDNRNFAMLASWVQQASFEPPAISIALSKDRDIRHAIVGSNKLALCVVPERDTSLMKRYARGIPDGANPFEGVATITSPAGLPMLSDSLAYLEGRLLDVFDFGADHDLFVAEVTHGQVLGDGKAFSHQRGSGFHY